MATEDISRFLFQPNKRYSSVRMQQGRVLLDSDWNEYEQLENETNRQTLIDIVCAKGTSNNGFRVGQPIDTEVTLPQTTDDDDAPPTPIQTYDFEIASGSFYLGGLRFQAEDPPQTFLSQSDWLQIDATAESLPERPTDLEGDEVRYDLVYLRGWEQCVTAVEDSELREQALGGPDSSVRVRRMRRVEVLPDVPDTCAAAFAQLQEQLSAAPITGEQIHSFDERTCELQSGVRLTVSSDGNSLAEDPCRPESSSGYLGADNQTIRVQLTAPNRFIWGYDNAAPLYRVQVHEDGKTIHFLTLPRDQEAQPLAGQAVEIIPWGAFLPNREKVAEFQGQLFTVATSYNPADNSITLAEPVSPEWSAWLAEHTEYWSDRDWRDEDSIDRRQYFYLRLWTGGTGEAARPYIEFTPETPIPLPGTGLSVTFNGFGLAGDFWAIAARPNTPNDFVPWELKKAAAPAGPKTYFAPLALIRWSLDENSGLQADLQDCRDRFRPLCDVQGCCTVTVGDGRTSHGLFNSLEGAIAFLPAEGGKICLLPGRHQANVSIENRQNIQITGCGFQTIVQPLPGQESQPIFQIASCQNIQLEQMTLVAQATIAIQVLDPPDTQRPSQGIHILENKIIACIHAIEIQVNNARSGNNDIRIAHNQMGLLDKQEGKAIIFCLADDVLIERNRLVVLPPPDADNPDDPRNPDDFVDDPFDPCFEPEQFSDLLFLLGLWVAQTLQYITQLDFIPPRIYQALGGIQIGGGSETIRIINNDIIGGRSHGIALGHWPSFTVGETHFDELEPFLTSVLPEVLPRLLETFVGSLYDIEIAENRIRSMGLSGIGVGAFLLGDRIGLRVRVEDLTVYRNSIVRCAQQIPAEIPDALSQEMGFGGIALTECENAVIQENEIFNNGLTHRDPICGIFLLYGEKIDITNNRILNNGPRTTLDNINIRQGFRGGIVIGMSFQQISNDLVEGEELLSPDGIPAVKIHNNIVTQPLAQALFIIAFGPVSVVGNQLTSQSIAGQANPISLLAGTVYILNLGVSKDLITLLLLLSFLQIAKNNPDSLALPPVNLDALRRILYLPSGNILFADNQTTLDLRTNEVSFTVSSQLLASFDDIAYNSNQSECTSLVDLILTNTLTFGTTLRHNDNRFQEGLTVTFYSLVSLGIANMATGNQATHCLIVLPLSSSLRVEELNTVLYRYTVPVFDDRFSCKEEKKLLNDKFGMPQLTTANSD